MHFNRRMFSAIALLWLLLASSARAQQEFEKLDDLYAKLRHRDTCGRGGDSVIKAAHGYLDNLRKLVAAELKPKFSGTVGWVGNDAGENELAKFDVKLGSDIGEYPLQFDLSAGLSAVLDEDGLSESISDVDVSLDYHPLDDLWLEVYGSAAGASNTFLGIDRRYSAGTGAIFSWYTPWLLSPGEASIESIGKERAAFEKTINGYDALVKSELSAAEKKSLSHIWNGARLSARKRNTVLRLAVLTGLTGEIEHVVADDEVSWSVVEGGSTRTFDTTISHDFGSRYRLLILVRPTIVFRPIEAISIRAESYIQFPAAPSWADDVPAIGGVTADRTDIQFDSRITLGVSVKKDTKIELAYQYISDHLPRMEVLTDGAGNEVLVEAPSQFSKTSIGVKFEF